MTWSDVEICNFCGSSEFELYLESDTPTWYAGRYFRLIQCRECGFVPASPRPNPVDLYKNYLAGTGNVNALVQEKLARKNVNKQHRRVIESASKHLTRSAERLYDMGCGAGTVMAEAKAMGIEPDGNDVNKCSIEMLRDLGFNARHGFTNELNLPSGAYDIVANLDYLEHTFNPFDDLKTCARILAPGGILYLKTLYLGSPAHRLMRENWKMFGQGHFSFFSARVLKQMIVSAGFEILKTSRRFELITVIARRH